MSNPIHNKTGVFLSLRAGEFQGENEKTEPEKTESEEFRSKARTDENALLRNFNYSGGWVVMV